MKLVVQLFPFLLCFAAANTEAAQYCGNLQRNSAAYYSCESLNQQERYEDERRQQEMVRRAEQDSRDREQRRQREANELARTAKERVDSENARTKQMDVLTAIEMLPWIASFAEYESALKAGSCSRAQKAIDLMKAQGKLTQKSYVMKGKNISGADMDALFDEGVIAAQINVYLYQDCFGKSEGEKKAVSYLQLEASKGSGMAKTLLESEWVRELVAKHESESKKVPKFADYQTDMLSIAKYTSELAALPKEACIAGWRHKNPDAGYCLALREIKNKELALLKEVAELGHPIAQNNLAMHMSDSQSPGNSAEIAKLISAAAQRGIPHAQVTVGWWHMTGEHGFKIDHAAALTWNLKAYKQGHSEGANNIGELYEKGWGVPNDIETAKAWYTRASGLGNAGATQRLKKMEQKLGTVPQHGR